MFDSRIIIADATLLGFEDQLAPVQSMLDRLRDFAVAAENAAATQHEITSAGPASLAARYAAANSVSRRRFDAILREAETTATVGLRLIVGHGQSDPAVITAARFLGTSIATAIRRLEYLVPQQAI